MKKKLCLMAAILLVILAFSACSVNEENPEQNNQTLLEDDSQDSLNNSESKFESMAESNTENNEETKEIEEQLPSIQVSEEVQNLRQKMEDFCQAYFSGDIEDVKEFLTDPYSWDIDVYENPEEVKNMETKDITGLAGISELSDSEKYCLSQPFEVPGEDSWTCLSGHGVHGALGKLPSHSPGKSAGQEGGTGIVGGSAKAGGAAFQEGASGHGFDSGKPSCGNHQLRHHGAAGMPHIDAEAGQEAVYLLADF